ncbi:MAG: histidinol-phosphate transaminase, partial [Chloroflexi bacterium HGW-Chloroflexi-1]
VKPQRGLSAIQPYVPGKPIEEVKREYGLTDVIKLASNENPLGASPKVLAALAAALPELNLYPDARSYTLRQAIARCLGVPAKQITVGNGSDGIIREVCVAYLEDGDEVIVSRSSFPVYDISVNVMRGRLVKTPLTADYRLDLTALVAAITDRTRLIFVCNPNNPTGTIVTADEVDAFMAQAPDHVLVVFDEAYYEFVDAAGYPDTLRYVREGRGNVMVLRTFSKGYGIAGIRLGYGVAQPELLAPMNACKESFSVNRLAQVAGLAALEDDEFLHRTLAMNRAGLAYLYEQLDRLGLNYLESQTNFVLLEVGPGATAVFQALLQKGVIVRSCVGYDLPHWLRVTVGTPEQNARFIAALETVLESSGQAVTRS